MLKLTRPLVTFDLETTGLGDDCRIVQLGYVTTYPNGDVDSRVFYIDPDIDIEEGASVVHGLTIEKLREKGARFLAHYAEDIRTHFEACDLCGFNIEKFDLPVLKREMARVGFPIDLEGVHIVDVMRIYHKLRPRNLAAAYTDFCGKELDGAHDALVDTQATVEILRSQVSALMETSENISTPAELEAFTRDPNACDRDGKFVWTDSGEVAFNFGANKGKLLRDVPCDYLQWMLKKDFSTEVHNVCKHALKGIFPTREVNDERADS